MWVSVKKFLYILPVLLIFIGECSSLKDVRVIIPTAVKRGENAVLKCQYDIESDLLYTVKWYRGDKEFYRFTPKEVPAMKVFSNIGFKVSRKNSSASVVTLENVEPMAAGRYSCEVSADAPSFLTYVVSGTMDVVEIPIHQPVITGVKPRYRIGNLLRGNCTSKHSRPAANLTWYINGQTANPSHTKRYKSPEPPNSDGLETAVHGIHFLVAQHHFEKGKLKIRCTASMYGVYWQSTEKSIEEEKVKGGKGSGMSEKSNVVNIPPESQHVALMYPGYGTALDPDPPPSFKESSHVYGGSRASANVDCRIVCAMLLLLLVLFDCRPLNLR